MGRIFQRKQFSDYLGENRAILDIVTNYIPELCGQMTIEYSPYPSVDGTYTIVDEKKVTTLDIITSPSSSTNGQFFKKNGENTYLFFNEPGYIFQFYTGVTDTSLGIDLTSNKVPYLNRIDYSNYILINLNKTYPESGFNVIPPTTGETSYIDYIDCPIQVPICPQQITIYDSDPSLGSSILNRLYDYSGGSLTSVYCNSYNDSVPENYTAWTRNVQIGGYNYPAWGGYGITFPSYYYYLAWDTQYNGWVYFRMIDSNRPIYSGMTSPLPISYNAIYTGTTFVGNTAYPILENPIYAYQNGMWSDPCPSPSPTPTPSPSPAVVTATPTPTVTPTPTASPIPVFNIGTGFDAQPGAIFIDNSDDIFVGGVFYGYDSTISYGMAKIDTNGVINNLFASGSNTMLYNSSINGITEDETGNYIYVYGLFTTPSQRIAKIDKTTGINVWSGLTLVTNGSVNSVVVDQNTGDVYIGGSFTSVQGQTRNRIAKLNSSGTLDVSTFVGAAFNNTVNGLFLNRNGNLICFGTFTTYFGVASTRLIEIETVTYTKTALWGSGQSGGGSLDSIFQRTDNGEYFTVGNTVYTINGASPTYVGKYDETGVNIPFTPTGIPTAIPIGLYLDETNNYIYIGSTAGYGNSGILRVDTVSGNVDTTFTNNIGTYLPKNISPQPLTKIIQLDSSNRIYRIGNFVFINGVAYNRIVRYLQNGTINTISA